MVEEDAKTGKKLLARAPFSIAGQIYVADAYQGNHPSLDPTDVLVAEQKTGNIDLIVLQKGIAPPPILKALITPPVQFVNANDTVNLDGTHSIGKIVSYKWAQVSGPAVVIQNDTLSIAKFTEPNTQEDIVVSLTVADTNTHTDTATATIKVQVVPPVGMITVQNVDVTTAENTPVTVQLTGQDTNAGATSITLGIATPPKNGTANIVITTGATTPITGSVNAVYKPNTGFTGTDSFTYTASDNLGNVSKPGTVTVTVGSAPPPPPDVDKFGVKKVYGDGPGSNYFMSTDPNSDPRGNNPEASSSYKPKFISNPDGSFKIKGQLEIRGAITQDNGYHESQLCTDFVKATQQGFMQDEKDWKDIEMTSYYRINQAGTGTSNGEAHIEHVMRGQRSTTSNTSVGVCGKALGCSNNYHGNIYCNKGSDGPARQKYERDLFHTTGYSKDQNSNGPVNNNTAYNFKKGQWFGIKTIVYNLPNGNVQLEHWTDENNTNTWKKTHSLVDSPGAWPPRGAIGNCNTDGSKPITFGGPLTVFRSDNLADYDVKFQSIRSIDSTKRLMGAEHDRKTSGNPTTKDEPIVS